jgi:hypothetical protein
LQLEGTGQIWYRNVYLKVQDKSLDFPPRQTKRRTGRATTSEFTVRLFPSRLLAEIQESHLA